MKRMLLLNGVETGDNVLAGYAVLGRALQPTLLKRDLDAPFSATRQPSHRLSQVIHRVIHRFSQYLVPKSKKPTKSTLHAGFQHPHYCDYLFIYIYKSSTGLKKCVSFCKSLICNVLSLVSACGKPVETVDKLCIGFLVFSLLLCVNQKISYPQEPKEVVVHHSDSTHMSLQECNDWHRARGWDSCGYHFIIEPTGEIVPARPLNKKGAHCRGHNNLTGVVFVGKDMVNQSQVSAFWRLMAKLGHPKFYGHRDMSEAHTECPGEKIWKEIGLGKNNN